MYKKYKQMIIGFVLGALIFSFVPVGAAVQEYICQKANYKILINGSEYVSEDLPILNYDGNTYAPLRPMLEKAGLTVNWNTELNQAEATESSIVLEQQEIIQSTETINTIQQEENNMDNNNAPVIEGYIHSHELGKLGIIVKTNGIPPAKLMYDDNELEVFDYKVIDSKMYFNIEVLEQLGINQ